MSAGWAYRTRAQRGWRPTLLDGRRDRGPVALGGAAVLAGRPRRSQGQQPAGPAAEHMGDRSASRRTRPRRRAGGREVRGSSWHEPTRSRGRETLTPRIHNGNARRLRSPPRARPRVTPWAPPRRGSGGKAIPERGSGDMTNGSGLASVQARRRADAGEPVVRPHARLSVHGRATCRRPGQPFEGLTGTESNPDSNGEPVTCSGSSRPPRTPTSCPAPIPGEGYMATNDQFFGSDNRAEPVGRCRRCRASSPTTPTRSAGSPREELVDRAGHRRRATSWAASRPRRCRCCPRWPRGFAVCDHWFALGAHRDAAEPRVRAAPAPARGTWTTRRRRSPRRRSSACSARPAWPGRSTATTRAPLTKPTFTDIAERRRQHFGMFTDFQAAAAAGTLPGFTLPGAVLERRPATASTRTTTWRSASSSSTTSTRRCATGPAGSRRC